MDMTSQPGKHNSQTECFPFPPLLIIQYELSVPFYVTHMS